MEWETTYDAEPGSDWAPPPPAMKETRPHKDLVKWQPCFRDNCSVHRWEKVDAGYYPRIVGSDGVLSKRDETHCKRRKTVMTQHEGEGGEKTSSDVERLEKEILVLWEQLNRAAETVVLKDQQLIKLDNDYRALRRSEHQVSQELAREQRAHEETKVDRAGLKLLMRDISKNYYLRPERPVHLTHGTPRTQTDVLDVTSDRRRIRKIPASSSHVLTPSGHGPFRPVRPDDV